MVVPLVKPLLNQPQQLEQLGELMAVAAAAAIQHPALEVEAPSALFALFGRAILVHSHQLV